MFFIFVVLHPLVLVFHTLTVWIVVLVTFARYLCIVRPMDVQWRNLRRMKIATIWLLVLSVLLNTPTILETLVRIYSYCNCAFNILEVRSSTCLAIDRFENEISISAIMMKSFIGSFLPLIILIILNLRIALALHTLTKKRRQMSLQIIKERNLTKTLVMVVGIFAVCQIPRDVLYLMYVARFSVDYEVLVCALGISNALIVLNSPMNFLIYCLFSKRFKQIFCGMLPCHKRPRANVAMAV